MALVILIISSRKSDTIQKKQFRIENHETDPLLTRLLTNKHVFVVRSVTFLLIICFCNLKLLSKALSLLNSIYFIFDLKNGGKMVESFSFLV